jgi:hypothetical protein
MGRSAPAAVRLAPLLAVATAGLAAGCAWTVNVAVYRLWPLVPAGAFLDYQSAHERHFVPVALLLGGASLLAAGWLARRGLVGVPGAALWGAVALAAVPWLATPLYFLPLQSRLAAAGPRPDLVGQLVLADLLLRALPPTLQLAVLVWAAGRARRAIPVATGGAAQAEDGLTDTGTAVLASAPAATRQNGPSVR